LSDLLSERPQVLSVAFLWTVATLPGSRSTRLLALVSSARV